MRLIPTFCSVFLLGAVTFGQNGEKKSGLDLSAMDTTADPCNDFYQYSCGGWVKANPIPADKTSWGRYAEMANKNRIILHDILEQAAVPKADRTPIQKQIGDYYAACMDEAGIEKKGLTPLKPEFAKIAAIKSRQDLAKTIAYLHKRQVGALFRFSQSPDLRNASMMSSDLDQGGLGLPDRDYYLKADPKSVERREKYLEHMQKMFELLGDSPEKSAAHAKTVMSIETDLAKASLDLVSRREPKNVDHKMQRTEVLQLAANVDLPAYWHELGAPGFKEMNVAVPEFLKAVNGMVVSVPLDDWKTYLRWHLVRSSANALSADFVNESFRFNGAYMRGAKQIEPRWERCVRSVDGHLGEALGQTFVEKYFGADGKARMTQLVESIMMELGKSIKESDWMSAETKTKALEKLAAIDHSKLGYNGKWHDYSKVAVSRTDYFGDLWNANVDERRQDIAKIGKPVDKTEWGMTPPTVNAYYDPQQAEIVFPAGMLQPPMFGRDVDDPLNFGAVGRVTGHELSHGFDDEGRHFDAKGNLTDWWTADDAKAFEERAACYADQYSEYVVLTDAKTGEKIKLNGKLTLGENIADNGGIRMAYLAMQDVMQGKSHEKIDGFTPEQRFFLSYAHTRCENTTEQTARMLVATDPHSNGKYRLIGAVTNMPEFWEAFGCKKGQPMVREKPCKIW